MKIGKWKNCLWKILWLAATAVCYLSAVLSYQRMEAGSDLTTVELRGAFPNINEAKKIYELEKEQEEPVDFTMWTSMGKQQVSNADLGRSGQVPVIALCRRAELYLPQAMALGEEDENGCIIDQGTAQELFGSVNAVGCQVTVRGKVYEVREVLNGKERVLLLQGSGDDLAFSMVNLKHHRDGNSKEEALAFLMRYHLEGEVVDGSVLLALGKGLLLLLPLLLEIQLLFLLYAEFKESRGSLQRHLLMGILICAAAAVFLYWFLDAVSISKDMIPSRWSDFGFWTEKWKEKKNALLFFLQSAKSPGQMRQMTVFAQSCIFSLAACLGYFFSMHKKS